MMRSKLDGLRRRAERWTGRARPVVLMYHRVTELAADPWRLAVSPRNFAEQIDAICRTRRVVPIDQLDGPDRDRPLAAITFDDGYRDVATTGRAILERHDCPATVFITTGAIGAEREFWWDELTRILLETPIPAPLEIRIEGETQGWRLDPHMDPRALERAHLEIWQVLRARSPAVRAQILDRLAAQVGAGLQIRDSHRIMSAEDVASLRGGPICVGAHTVTHPSLPDLQTSEQAEEIEQSRRACEALTGASPTSFAYPFGDFDDVTAELVKKAGFARAFTVERGVLRSKTDPWRLPRVAVGDWDGETLLRNLP